MSNKTARLAKAGIMIALAFILSYVESLLPAFTGIPGVKIGLANIVTIVALYVLDWKYAMAISLVRVVLAGLIFNGMSAMIYGLAGAALSLVVMILLRAVNTHSGRSDLSGRSASSSNSTLSDSSASSGGSVINSGNTAPQQFNARFSLPAISVAGGVAHNIGQILVAWAVLGSAVLYYLPVLIVSGLIAGFVTGIIAYYVIKYTPQAY